MLHPRTRLGNGAHPTWLNREHEVWQGHANAGGDEDSQYDLARLGEGEPEGAAEKRRRARSCQDRRQHAIEETAGQAMTISQASQVSPRPR